MLVVLAITQINHTDFSYREILGIEDVRKAYVDDLFFCESGNNAFAQGDGGHSNGWGQWQKPSLEDVMSRKYGYRVELSWEEYWNIVTDYDQAYYWTYYAIYELDQGWRWENCVKKLSVRYQNSYDD